MASPLAPKHTGLPYTGGCVCVCVCVCACVSTIAETDTPQTQCAKGLTSTSIVHAHTHRHTRHTDRHANSVKCQGVDRTIALLVWDTETAHLNCVRRTPVSYSPPQDRLTQTLNFLYCLSIRLSVCLSVRLSDWAASSGPPCESSPLGRLAHQEALCEYGHVPVPRSADDDTEPLENH